MKWLTLDYIKQHLRIDNDCEDNILTLYGESAEETILKLIRRTYDELIETYGCVPSPLYHAALMLVDVSYQYRSPVGQTMSIVPYTFDLLVKPYMKLSDNVQH